MAEPQLILASQSPRRRQLLADGGIAFEVIVSNAAEPRVSGEKPEDMVRRLAKLKAAAVGEEHPDKTVLAADTIVVINGEILGKPRSLDEARAMLAKLSGQVHQVMTGVDILKNGVHDVFVVTSHVRFKSLTTAGIEEYISAVNVLDKAGSYAIQEQGDKLVESIEGSWSNIVGLPMEAVREHLQPHRGSVVMAFLAQELIRYFLVAVGSLCGDFGVYSLLVRLCNVHYSVSAAAGFVVGNILNYLLCKKYVFQQKARSSAAEFCQYTFIGLLGLGWLEILLYLLIQHLHCNELLAKLLATGIVFFWNYFGRRFLSRRRTAVA